MYRCVREDSFGFRFDLGFLVALWQAGGIAVQEVVDGLPHLVAGLLLSPPIVDLLLLALEHIEQFDGDLDGSPLRNGPVQYSEHYTCCTRFARFPQCRG